MLLRGKINIPKDQVGFEAPILANPDYTKDFFIFFFASEETIVVVLLQKNGEGHEQPIAFFSKYI
jgi:hypothetical protein